MMFNPELEMEPMSSAMFLFINQVVRVKTRGSLVVFSVDLISLLFNINRMFGEQ